MHLLFVSHKPTKNIFIASRAGILCHAYEKLNPHVQLEKTSCKLTDIPQLAGVKSAEGAVTAIHSPSASSDFSMRQALTPGNLKNLKEKRQY